MNQHRREGDATAHWEEVGPVLPGGDVYVLAGSSHAFSAMQMAGTAVGLFSSTDGGRSWRLMSGGLGALPVMAVALPTDDTSDRTIIVGGAPGAVFRSVSGGVSWEASYLDFPDATVTVLATSPAFPEDGVVLAGTARDGIYRSVTRGRHWEAVNFGLYDLTVWSLALSPAWQTDQTAFAVVGSWLFQSTNGARAWKPVRCEALESLLPQVVAVSPEFAADGRLFLGTEGDGIWVSLDRGKTWRASQGTDGMTVNCFAFSTAFEQDRVVYAGTAEDGILCSRDSGMSWKALRGLHSPVLSLAQVVTTEGQFVLAGVQDRGVYRCALPSQDWEWCGQNLAARPLSMLSAAATSTEGTTLFVGGESGLLLRSDDGGRNWERVGEEILPGTGLSCFAVSPDFSQDGLILAGTADGILRCSRMGHAWETVPLEKAYRPIRALAFSSTFAEDHIAWACPNHGCLLFSDDGGRSWHAKEMPCADEQMTSVALSPTYPHDRTLIVTTVGSAGGEARYKLWRSTDNAERWEQVWEHQSVSGWIALAAPQAVRSRLPYDQCYMGVGNEVFCPSLTAKDMWIGRRLPDREAQVLSLQIASMATGHRVLVGTSRGLFISPGDGQTWERLPGGPEQVPILGLAASPSGAGRSCYVLALGGALWRCAFG